jgi:inorganic triphosphatase YgiF
VATEIELKLRFIDEYYKDPLAKIKDCLQVQGLDHEFTAYKLKNSYFDTPDWQLNKQKIALRVREKAGVYIQTLKTKGQSVNGLSQRGEWEWDLGLGLEEPVLDTQQLGQCKAWPESVDMSLLAAVFETNFTRHQLEFNWQGARIELAVDLGEILSRGRLEKINEIELELRPGESGTFSASVLSDNCQLSDSSQVSNGSQLRSFGDYLQEHLPLEPFDVSKAERGYGLFKN